MITKPIKNQQFGLKLRIQITYRWWSYRGDQSQKVVKRLISYHKQCNTMRKVTQNELGQSQTKSQKRTNV